MAKIPRYIWLPIVAVVVVLVSFGAGFTAGGLALDSQVTPQEAQRTPAPDFPLIEQAWSVINREFVDRAAIQTKPMTYGAILGMVDSLGDTGHSTFLTPDMARQEGSFLAGNYVGVGLEVESKNGLVMIVAPLDDSPAVKAGLKAGEEIVRVNGTDVHGLILQEVVRRIAGPKGSEVTLTIFDPATRRTFDVTLTRESIHVTNVAWSRIPGYPLADLRISAFSQGVTKETVQALKQIQSDGAAGIVLDLRNDPGGELDQAIGVASQFLSAGNVLLEKNAAGKIQDDPVKPGGAAPVIPMVVLVNHATVSAAEIVSGALQDAGRARLIGETTFGTGTVLERFQLSDGSVLQLAVKEWLTPKGRTIWHKGITPDIPVPLDPSAGILTPAALKSMSRAQVDSSPDVQLRKAIEVLSKESK